MRLLRYRELKSLKTARKNRLEIIKARLTRREMMKAGLLTAGGLLVFKNGLSQWASGYAWAKGGSGSSGKGSGGSGSGSSGKGGGGDDGGGSGSGSGSGSGNTASPPTRAFIDPLPIMAIRQPVTTLTGPAPTVAPNTSGGEGRTRDHQAFEVYPSKFTFPPKLLFETHQKVASVTFSPDLPVQTMWGHDGVYPSPTHYAMYGQDVLVRNFNDLPDTDDADNSGFGLPSVSTHLHNGHTPSESDGFPCDFFASGDFYDHHYPNVLAGFGSTNTPNGDINESLSTLWYHDHRVDFTSQNVYKGLTGFYCLFNGMDTGNETTGFRLPGVPGSSFFSPIQYDVPLMLADKLFDPDTGLLTFDMFNFDGILGDKFCVNGKVQPFFEVSPRRYRFRILNSGPSRFYQLFLTDQGSNTQIPFFQIATDGNLIPTPLSVTNTILGVAQRMDVIIDFSKWAGKTLYFENRMEQTNGRGPTGNTLAAGSGNFIMQFRVTGPTVADNSVDPATKPKYYSLPSTSASPRVSRSFVFERGNGQWQINGVLMDADCSTVRFQVQENSVENWSLTNKSGDWMHPVHIHFEEHQILSQNPAGVATDMSRKDVMRLQHNATCNLFFRFRDFTGRYPFHCHNVVHEDHAMMLRWDIVAAPGGDTNTNP